MCAYSLWIAPQMDETLESPNTVTCVMIVKQLLKSNTVYKVNFFLL